MKVMKEFNIQGKQTSFYKYCPGTFGYTLVITVPNVLAHKRTECPDDRYPKLKIYILKLTLDSNIHNNALRDLT
jgi:hypothetical protein